MDIFVHNQMELLPTSLFHCVKALAASVRQLCRMSLLLFHMCRILWPKCWLSELPYKKWLEVASDPLKTFLGNKTCQAEFVCNVNMHISGVDVMLML